MTRGFNYLGGCVTAFVTAFCFSAVKECPEFNGRSILTTSYPQSSSRAFGDAQCAPNLPNYRFLQRRPLSPSSCYPGYTFWLCRLINPHGRDVEGRAPTYLDHHSGIQGWCFISVLSPRLPHRTMPGSLIIYLYMIVTTVQYDI